ncbi:MAG: TIM-barrel domain-containing protein [Prolixibacteraceae bacterium]
MQKIIHLFLIFISIWMVSCAPKGYEKTILGMKATVDSTEIEVQFFSPEIVRILKSKQGFSFEKKSLSVIKSPEVQQLEINKNDHLITVKSSSLQLILDLVSGKVEFTDQNGNNLMAEKMNGSHFTPFDDAGKASFKAKQAFALENNEALYGLGQIQNGKLMQRGQTLEMKNSNLNITIPYFYSSKGYAVYWDNYAVTTFVDNDEETSFEAIGDCVDYYFMHSGVGTKAVAQMRDLTGQAPMAPLWAFGYWQSKERYKTQDELVGVLKKYRELEVPIDGIIQDWQYWGKDSMWNAMAWKPDAYPDPKGMADQVHALNGHLMVVAWPGFGPLTKQYKEFESKGMLINFDTWPPNGGVKPYDVYNPEARNIYWDYLNKGVFSIGTDAWWLDSTEPDHINVKDSDFVQPTYLGSYQSVSNAYSLQHTTGIYEHQRATTSDKRVYILTRSAFAGQQRNGANSWSGDTGSSWENLGKQIPAAVNFSLSGIPYWNADIGGFFAGSYNKDGGAKNPEFQELYVRWAQFSALTPMMRSHGTDIPREIYQFGKRGDWAFDAIEKMIKLRYRLLPYLYANAWQVNSNSASFMYALPVLFPEDKKVADLNDEYCFGPLFLVAPVIKPMYTGKKNEKVYSNFSKTQSRQVYLPAGSAWFDFWTGEKIEGGQEIDKAAPVDIVPLYVKAGSILPWGPEVQYAAEKKWDDLEIRIYPGADGEFTLYEDEGDNYNYEKGAYSTISFKWDNAQQTLSISDRQGEFQGMLSERQFRLVLVSETSGIGLAESTIVKTVTYTGKAVSEKL